MKWISDKRDNEHWWGVYQGIHGDLTGMSYLDYVQTFKAEKVNYDFGKYTVGNGNINLYISGDSYTRKLNPNVFHNLKSYHFGRRYFGQLKYHFPAKENNVLIIEIAERYFRDYFSYMRINEYDVFDSISHTVPPTNPQATSNESFINTLFNKNINQNLQYNLFNYNFLMPIFQVKAAINYHLFSRASGDVVISNSGDFLFLKETILSDGKNSSYSHISTEEKNQLIQNLNTAYDFYKNEGFTEVFLSIIPSTATMMQPENYNNLIPIIQNAPDLKMKIIDIYSHFMPNPRQYYLKGDTHWNEKGVKAWVDLVNHSVLL